LSETLYKLISLAKRDRGDFVSEDKIGLLVQLSAIFDRLRRLSIKFVRELFLASPIHILLRFMQTL